MFSAQVEVGDEWEIIPAYAIALAGCNIRCAFCITGDESWHPRRGQWHDAATVARRGTAAIESGRAKSLLVLGGESAYLWTARADVLLAQKQTRADYCLERAVTLDPANWLLHWLISRINSYYGRFVQALASIQKALALDASRIQLWLQAALCQQQLGLHAAAAESGHHALRLDPMNPLAREMVATLEMTPPLFVWWRRFRQFFRK